MNYVSFLMVSFSIILFSCSKENQNINNGNNANQNIELVAIQLDYLTGVPEAAYIYTNIKLTGILDSLPIDVNYQSPGDFGGVSLTWTPGQKALFDGTIIWMGIGERSFPQNMDPSLLTLASSTLPIPDSTAFQVLTNMPGVSEPGVDLNVIWSGLENLNLTHNRRDDLPMAVYHYTPDVGMGDPANWEYWIFIPQIPLMTTGN